MSLSFGLCLCAFFRAFLTRIYVYRLCCVLEWIPGGLPLDFSFSTLVTLSESPKLSRFEGSIQTQDFFTVSETGRECLLLYQHWVFQALSCSPATCPLLEQFSHSPTWQVNLCSQQAFCWSLSEVPIHTSTVCTLHRHRLIYFFSTYIRHVIWHQSGRESWKRDKELSHPRALRKSALGPEISSRLPLLETSYYWRAKYKFKHSEVLPNYIILTSWLWKLSLLALWKWTA